MLAGICKWDDFSSVYYECFSYNDGDGDNKKKKGTRNCNNDANSNDSNGTQLDEGLDGSDIDL